MVPASSRNERLVKGERLSSYSKQCDHAYWGILAPAEWFCVCSPRLYRIGPAPELEGWIATAINFAGNEATADRLADEEGIETIFPTRQSAARVCMAASGHPDCTHSFEIVDIKAPGVETRTVDVEREGATHYLWPTDVLAPERRAEIERQIERWALDGWTVGAVLGAGVGAAPGAKLPTRAVLTLGRIKREDL